MSSGKEVKEDRKYTTDHEWAREQEGELVIGITEFAVDQLGDITLVGLDVQPGDQVEAHKRFGTIESVKTLSDLFAPVSGEVTRVNEYLEDQPELVNADPWNKGWMLAIRPSNLEKEQAGLLDAAAYRRHLEESDH